MKFPLGIVVLLLVFAQAAFADIPSFPGATGYGTTTIGGRGGAVVFVTNTHASGPGSLKAAVDMSGPRIVVFRVGGTIEVGGTIMVRNPFITIAGQTAPGGGICIKNGMIAVKTHDVIIRGLRIRQSDDPKGTNPDIRDAMEIWAHRTMPGSVYNVVVDHNSFSWGVDVNLDIGGTAHDVTASWNIISEGLNHSIHPKGKHSKGLAFHLTAGTNLTAHHNLLAHNDQRNPKIAQKGQSEFINNVVYDFGKIGTDISTKAQTAVLGNYYLSGPSTEERRGSVKPIEIDEKALPAPQLRIYLQGNYFDGKPYADNWELMRGEREHEATGAYEGSGIPVLPAEEVYEQILLHAGAVAPARDAVDIRIVRSVKERTGSVIDSPRDVGGWPVLDTGEAPADGDDDGMPDVWELANGLDPNHYDADGDRNNDGYTNIEEYVNSLLPLPNNNNSDPQETGR